MPDLFFIATDGAAHAVQARAGQSAMQAALDAGVLHPQAGSHLSCQIVLSDALTGLVLHLPASRI